LSLAGLTVGYDRRPVLQDIHLSIRRGSFTALLGANGSGKSTLIKTLLGIIPPLAGQMMFPSSSSRAAVLGYTPQRDSLDPVFLLSSFEVALMGVCGRVGPGRFIAKSERDWAQECLRQAGADDLGRQRFSRLSGGQKQRVLIARALAARPDVLLLDEPTSGIDVGAKQAIMELLQQIHRQQRHTILMASHDLPVVRQYSERVIWLHQGNVLEGPVSDMLSRDKIEAIMDLQMD
jgi:ABC-type Mn2+/Zn2+ transport system ATPase subunit